MRLHNNAQGAYTLFFVMRLFGVYMQIVCLDVFGGRCVGKQVGLRSVLERSETEQTILLIGASKRNSQNPRCIRPSAHTARAGESKANACGSKTRNRSVVVVVVLCVCNVGFLVGDFRYFPLF